MIKRIFVLDLKLLNFINYAYIAHSLSSFKKAMFNVSIIRKIWMNNFRELCPGKGCVLPPNNRNMKESPKRKCPLPLMFCAREPHASLQLTSTTVDLSDSRKSQTTGDIINFFGTMSLINFLATFGNYSGTFFTAKALLTTTSLIGTCSSLEEAEVPRQRQSRDMWENEGGVGQCLVIRELFPS